MPMKTNAIPMHGFPLPAPDSHPCDLQAETLRDKQHSAPTVRMS